MRYLKKHGFKFLLKSLFIYIIFIDSELRLVAAASRSCRRITRISIQQSLKAQIQPQFHLKLSLWATTM